MFHLSHSKFLPHTREALHHVPVTPQGKRSDRWKGIQHGELVTSLVDTFKGLFGVQPMKEIYAVSPDGSGLLGGFTLGQPDQDGILKPLVFTEVPHETSWGVGFRHSNNSSQALTVAFGGQVSLCENGMIAGTDKWKHKHTKGLNVLDWIAKGLKGFWDKVNKWRANLAKLVDLRIVPRLHDELLLTLARTRMLSWRDCGLVDTLWQSSARDATSPWHDRTGWSWYNCVTTIAKKVTTGNQFKVLDASYQVLQTEIQRLEAA